MRETDASPGPEARAAAERFLKARFREVDLTASLWASAYSACLPVLARRFARRPELARQAPGWPIKQPAPTPHGGAGGPGAPVSPVSPVSMGEKLGPDFLPRSPSALLGRNPELASLPEMVLRLHEVIRDPRATPARAAEVVGSDPGLAARLLRLVNSALYAPVRPIEDLTRAVTMVGVRQLSTLAMGLAVSRIFKDIPPSVADVRGLWEHAVAVAHGARLLAALRNYADKERYFLFGLLHDVGRLAMFRNAPELSAAMAFQALEEGVSLRDVENRVLGFDHAAVGGALMRAWNLPPVLRRAVEAHHQPEEAPDLPEASAVHIADFLAHALGLGGTGSPVAPKPSVRAWQIINPPLEGLAEVLERMERETEDIAAAFSDNVRSRAA